MGLTFCMRSCSIIGLLLAQRDGMILGAIIENQPRDIMEGLTPTSEYCAKQKENGILYNFRLLQVADISGWKDSKYSIQLYDQFTGKTYEERDLGEGKSIGIFESENVRESGNYRETLGVPGSQGGISVGEYNRIKGGNDVITNTFRGSGKVEDHSLCLQSDKYYSFSLTNTGPAVLNQEIGVFVCSKFISAGENILLRTYSTGECSTFSRGEPLPSLKLKTKSFGGDGRMRELFSMSFSMAKPTLKPTSNPYKARSTQCLDTCPTYSSTWTQSQYCSYYSSNGCTAYNPATLTGAEGVSSFTCAPSCLATLSCASVYCKTFSDLSSLCNSTVVTAQNYGKTRETGNMGNTGNIGSFMGIVGNRGDRGNVDYHLQNNVNFKYDKNDLDSRGLISKNNEINTKNINYGNNKNNKNINNIYDINLLSSVSSVSAYINYPVIDAISNQCINTYLSPISSQLDILTFDVSLQLSGTSATIINNDPQAILALRSAGVNSLSGVFLENIVILSVTDTVARKLRDFEENVEIGGNGGKKETDSERFLRHNSGPRKFEMSASHLKPKQNILATTNTVLVYRVTVSGQSLGFDISGSADKNGTAYSAYDSVIQELYASVDSGGFTSLMRLASVQYQSSSSYSSVTAVSGTVAGMGTLSLSLHTDTHLSSLKKFDDLFVPRNTPSFIGTVFVVIGIGLIVCFLTVVCYFYSNVFCKSGEGENGGGKGNVEVIPNTDNPMPKGEKKKMGKAKPKNYIKVPIEMNPNSIIPPPPEKF